MNLSKILEDRIPKDTTRIVFRIGTIPGALHRWCGTWAYGVVCETYNSEGIKTEICARVSLLWPSIESCLAEAEKTREYFSTQGIETCLVKPRTGNYASLAVGTLNK